MTETCENCAESAGMVDDKFVWCKVEGDHGGIVSKGHRCWKFEPSVESEPDAADHWPADNAD